MESMDEYRRRAADVGLKLEETYRLNGKWALLRDGNQITSGTLLESLDSALETAEALRDNTPTIKARDPMDEIEQRLGRLGFNIFNRQDIVFDGYNWIITRGNEVIARIECTLDVEKWIEAAEIGASYSCNCEKISAKDCQPNWKVSPGELLLDHIVGAFAARAGIDRDEMGKLLNDEHPITESIAKKLELSLGLPCAFWLNTNR